MSYKLVHGTKISFLNPLKMMYLVPSRCLFPSLADDDLSCVGMHATVLNKVVSEMKEAAEDPSSYDSIDAYMGGRPLKEVLGHTPRQASGCCKGSVGRGIRQTLYIYS